MQMFSEVVLHFAQDDLFFILKKGEINCRVRFRLTPYHSARDFVLYNSIQDFARNDPKKMLRNTRHKKNDRGTTPVKIRNDPKKHATTKNSFILKVFLS